MDPHLEKTPGLALPNPATEQGFNGMPPQPGFVPHEAILPGTEVAPNPVGAPPIMPPQLNNATVPATSTASPTAPDAGATTIPTVPSDDSTDALDEEWINKAKAIVEQTKHDPHMESAQLGKVKAEYLRIRYNKHIKVAEEQSK